MAMSLPGYVDSVLLLQVFPDLQCCSLVCRQWRASARKAAPSVLFDSYIDSRALMNHLGWAPNEDRLRRIMTSAAEDLPFVEPGPIRQICVIQLCLQHMMQQGQSFPYPFPLRTVLDLLARAVSGLGANHPVVNEMRVQFFNEEELSRNTSAGVPYILRTWRNGFRDYVSIRGVIDTLEDAHTVHFFDTHFPQFTRGM